VSNSESLKVSQQLTGDEPFLEEFRRGFSAKIVVECPNGILSENHIVCPHCRSVVGTHGKLSGNHRCSRCRGLFEVNFVVKCFVHTKIADTYMGNK